MRFLAWLLTTVIALSVAAWLLDGIRFEGSSGTFTEQVQDKWLVVLLVSLVLGIVTAVVRPVLNLLSLPFIILTLGLFLFVTTALMLLLTDWIAGKLELGFHVESFGSALAGAVIITVVTWLLDLVTERD